MEEGEYLATSYEKTMYRGAKETVFFLLPLGENEEPITDAEVPLWGYFGKRRRKKCNFPKSMDGCFAAWGGRKEPLRENRTGLCRCPRRGPRRGPRRDIGVELCPPAVLKA